MGPTIFKKKAFPLHGNILTEICINMIAEGKYMLGIIYRFLNVHKHDLKNSEVLS